MRSMTHSRGRAVLVAFAVPAMAAALSSAAGCGLISSDITAISFNLPARQYVFDTERWSLPEQALPSVACAETAECCALASLANVQCEGGPAGASLVCESSACAVRLDVETPPQEINLQREVPELSGINTQSLADVYISKIQYSVVSTLETELPAVELFLAPADATSFRDERARKFGTVPPIPAGANLDGEVILEPDSQATLAGYARSPGTPFVFLAASTVLIRGGDVLPRGKVDITVRGQLRAQLSLR